MYKPYPKTTRLYSPVTITEKVDGTCGVIMITDDPTNVYQDYATTEAMWQEVDDEIFDRRYWVGAGSKARQLAPTKLADNYGFCRWVHDNARSLVIDLGLGVHHGEWAGKGIQRNYGLDAKYFFLFNTRRFADAEEMFETENLCMVPLLLRDTEFTDLVVSTCAYDLTTNGSRINSFPKSEGICIFWQHDNSIKKVVWDK